MKLIITILFLFIHIYSHSQKSIDFSRKNFPDRKNELKRAKRLIAKGHLFFENQKYKTAFKFYDSAYKFNPNNAQLNYQIALCNFYNKTNEMGLKFFLKADSLDYMSKFKLYFQIAQAYHLTNQYHLAIEYYNKSISLLNSENDSTKKNVIKEFIVECQNGNELLKHTNSDIEIKHLNNNINSVYDDYALRTSQNGKFIVFTRKKSDDLDDDNLIEKKDEDIYFTTSIDTSWLLAKNIGFPINTNTNEASSYLSADGKILYLYADVNGGDIFYSKKTELGWAVPRLFAAEIISEFHESSLCFSNDGKVIYFVSDRIGSYGGKDIYFLQKIDSIHWSKPQNLGHVINTNKDENDVFVNGDTLYFSSSGHNSCGGFDIFKTFKNSVGEWSKPENLRFPINSPFDDVYYYVNESKRYFSSNRIGGNGGLDIYSIENIRKYPDLFVTTKIDSICFVKKDSLKSPMTVFKIRNLMFKNNQFENPDAYQILDSLANFLKQNPQAIISINGYTDEYGDNDYNLWISIQRANFVYKYLIAKNVPKSNLKVQGHGKKVQIALNKNCLGYYDAESMKYNRRVEFNVICQGNSKIEILQIEVPEKYKIKH